MKTYLVNPSEKRILDNAGDRIPIGLLNMASNAQVDTKIYDLNHTSSEQFFKDFYREKPDAVGISVYTSPIVREARHLARALKGKTKLIAGGYHATAMPETLTDDFDIVVRGEADFLWDTLAISKYKGIVESGRTDLGMLKRSDYSKLDLSKYGLNQSGKRTGTLITSRGCFGNCSFCGKLPGKIAYEGIDKVKDDIYQLEKEFDSLYFLDDVFTFNKDRMQQIVESTTKPFRVTTRADLIDKSKLEILADNGCEWLSLGIESGNDDILNRSNKGITTQQNYDAVKMANDFGIKTKGFFIIGLPGESKETAKQTIDFADWLRGAGLNSADFYYLTPFPGTPIWNKPEAFGITINDTDFTKYLEAGKNARCVVDTENLKSNKIESLVQEAKSQWQN